MKTIDNALLDGLLSEARENERLRTGRICAIPLRTIHRGC